MTIVPAAPGDGHTPDSDYRWQAGARLFAPRPAGARSRSPRVPPSAFAAAAAQLPAFPAVASHANGRPGFAPSARGFAQSGSISPAGSALLPDPACFPPPAPQLAPQRGCASFEGFSMAADLACPWGSLQGLGRTSTHGPAYPAHTGATHVAGQASAPAAQHAAATRRGSLPSLHCNPVPRYAAPAPAPAPATNRGAAMPGDGVFRRVSLGGEEDMRACQQDLGWQAGSQSASFAVSAVHPALQSMAGSGHLQRMQQLQQHSQCLAPSSQVRSKAVSA